MTRANLQNRRARRGALILGIMALAPLACSDATDIELLEINADGVLFGQAFLDLDGSGTVTTADEPISEVDVVLRTTTSANVINLATTDSLGAFTLFDVPVGTYRLSLDPEALGDSLEVVGMDGPISVVAGDTSLVNLSISFPVLTLEQVLSAPLGRRVFTSGIALNSRVNFDPTGQVHFAGDSLFLRGLNVERSSFGVGDSLRLLGRIANDNGRPALDAVTPLLLISQAAIVTPADLTVRAAATADGGPLDAGLARIRDADITDTTTTLDGDFSFWAIESGDSIEVIIRSFLGLNTSAFRPDTIVRVDQLVGLLSPIDNGTGGPRWRLLPRGGGDIALESKVADIAVGLTLDTAQASLGDTVEITVVASNGGPLMATGVEVRDTVPSALAFVSATATVGSYDSGSGIWSVGDLPNAASDTLRIRMEVMDGTPAVISNIAESLGLTFEIDGNAGNNLAVLFLTIL